MLVTKKYIIYKLLLMEMSALAGEGAKQTLILIMRLTFHHIMLKEKEEMQKN